MPAYQVPLIDIEFAVKQVSGRPRKGRERSMFRPSRPRSVCRNIMTLVTTRVWRRSESGDVDQPTSWAGGVAVGAVSPEPIPQKGIFTSQPEFRLAETIGFWILPGVLARFPELKVVLVEPSLGWVPFYLDTSTRWQRSLRLSWS